MYQVIIGQYTKHLSTKPERWSSIGATTLRRKASSIMTLSITILSIMTLSIMTLNVMKRITTLLKMATCRIILSIMTSSIVTRSISRLSIVTLSEMPLSIKKLSEQ